MTGISSGSVVDRRIYAQDTQPVDERDGVMWIDTSVSPRQTYVYSTDSASWESISPSSTKVESITGGLNSVYGKNTTTDTGVLNPPVHVSDGFQYYVFNDNSTSCTGNIDYTTVEGDSYHVDLSLSAGQVDQVLLDHTAANVETIQGTGTNAITWEFWLNSMIVPEHSHQM